MVASMAETDPHGAGRVLVHVDAPGPRASYMIRHVLERMLGIGVVFAAGEEEFRSAALPRLRYGIPSEGVLTIPASGQLERVAPGTAEPGVAMLGGMPVSYPMGGNDFDLFAAAFHLLSRVEELGGHARDAHGRLPSAAHFTVRHGMSHLPVVDMWALHLHAALKKRYPGLPDPDRRYRHVLSVDVDNGMMVLGRPLWRQCGAFLRDVLRGHWNDAGMRMAVGAGFRRDPFDRYAWLSSLAERPEVERVLVFVLVKGGGSHDHAVDPGYPAYASALKAMSTKVQVGIHPSYDTSATEGLMAREIARLRELKGADIAASRQHFLRWKLPHTLREAVRNGIMEDHSLGFSDRCGFRAGTCTPFKWYDMEREQETSIELWPFACMDSALHDRMGSDPGGALHQMKAMSDAVRSVQGTFVSVWHDRFLSGYGPWKGWPNTLLRTLELAAP